MVSGFCTGLQHIGIPTTDIEKSKNFYQKLGFILEHKNRYEDNKFEVAFLSLGNLVLEVYEVEFSTQDAGAINHIAINVTSVEDVYKTLVTEGFCIVSDGVEFLSFFENGVRFFIIQGPNGERIEFSQRL